MSSRVLGIIAAIVQAANLAAGLLQFSKPSVALWIGAGVAAIQAFTARVQGISRPSN